MSQLSFSCWASSTGYIEIPEEKSPIKFPKLQGRIYYFRKPSTYYVCDMHGYFVGWDNNDSSDRRKAKKLAGK